MRYAELDVTTNFSFLRGASHADELVAQAKALGLDAIAVTDRNTLAGIVRAHTAAKAVGLRYIPGARLDMTDAPSLLCLPMDRAAYGRLSRLISLGQARAEKGQCLLRLSDVAAHAQGNIFICVPPDVIDEKFAADLHRVRAALEGEKLYLAASHGFRGDDRARMGALAGLARTCGAPLVATNAVLYHAPQRRPLQDVLTCVREHTTINEAGYLLAANAERHLKKPAEMARLFRGTEGAVARTIEIMEACRFSLDELVYEYPDEPVPPGTTAQAHLEALTWEGAAWRFPNGIPDKVRATIARELQLVADLHYAPYFLTVHDIVAFARARGILCQGRGSAANSVVCYCLGITAVNPTEVNLLFERFVSHARKEPPDIDVDFEHDRREEVIQYIYARYGRDRAGLAATVISYRARSAVRDVGKAMGLSEDTVSALAGMVWGTRSGGVLGDTRVREAGLDPADPLLATVLELTEELIGFPRHLSQHVGGFVLTRGPLIEMVPVGNAAMDQRTFIEWDKDDIAALGLLKVDILALGMLSCIRRAFELLGAHHGLDMTLAKVPREDPATYEMLCRADSIGVFQVESRAQMNMLPRLKPRCFYDLVIEVAIVRPGPIQGDMVHPYLRRRSGQEPEVYPSPAPEHGPADELRQILGKTKGVPLFQEQAMRIAMEAAKFSDEDVNDLRKAMATFRRRGTIGLLEEKMVEQMTARGYDREFAQRCFNQIKGFGEYGFPESHAASFAHLVYVSSWLKCHYPAAFACALLNSQPMGFYAPAQIVRDAREHGVEARAADINCSDWDSTLEDCDDGGPALRLGLRQIDGLQEEEIRKLEAARARGAFGSVHDLWQRAALRLPTLEKLAAADAFRSLGLDRRQALWEVTALANAPPLPLFAWSAARETGAEPEVMLPEMPLSEHVVNDYQTLRLSLKAHPMSFLRERLRAERVVTCAALRGMRDGQFVKVAGVILVRQRPGSAKGVVFMTLEDETGVANAVVWPKMLEKYRKTVMQARLMVISGRIQRHESIIHVVSNHLEDRSDWLMLLSEGAGDMPIPIANADEVKNPGPEPPEAGAEGHPRWSRGGLAVRPRPMHPREERVIPKSRDFH
ncbi:MAG: error-prone DNA polymerase [Hyphomicrobium sp.]|nr:error-prone DNA polymerase [Hyphomicrobium sp.]PPD07809.1 MAG: error-prone DNA polymerase [Hyphomicrobium sp.]